MASINQMIEAAKAAGFVRTDCVHEGGQQHIVLDYPEPLGEGTTDPHWRIHINVGRVPTLTHIVGTGTPQQRSSLVTAIAWARRISTDHPKN